MPLLGLGSGYDDVVDDIHAEADYKKQRDSSGRVSGQTVQVKVVAKIKLNGETYPVKLHFDKQFGAEATVGEMITEMMDKNSDFNKSVRRHFKDENKLIIGHIKQMRLMVGDNVMTVGDAWKLGTSMMKAGGNLVTLMGPDEKGMEKIRKMNAKHATAHKSVGRRRPHG